MSALLADAHANAAGGPVVVLLVVIYVASNLGITAGYASIPWTVLPHIRLPRRTFWFGLWFFLTCAGTHAVMGLSALAAGAEAIAHGMAGSGLWIFAVGWTVWHLVQVLATWGFILQFRGNLIIARARGQEMLTGPAATEPGGAR